MSDQLEKEIPKRHGFEIVFTVPPGESVLGITLYRGDVLVATTQGLYRVFQDVEGEFTVAIISS